MGHTILTCMYTRNILVNLTTTGYRLTFALVRDLPLANDVDGPGQSLVAHVTVGGGMVRNLYKLVTTDVHHRLLWK